MAIDNNATLKLSTIRFYTAPVGTARPVGIAALKEVPAPWDEVGNTSLENIFNITSEGGDKTTLGSAQNPSLRESIARRIESFELNLLEFKREALKFYYGANAEIAEDGAIEVPDSPVPTEAAFLAVIHDGDKVAGFYAAKGSIFRREDISLADTESLSELPIAVTALNNAGKKSSITVIPIMYQTREATGVAVISGGAVTAVNVTDPGSGYQTAPAVTITGDGTGATATAQIANGEVTAISVESAGTGYTTATVDVAPPA